MTAPAGWYPDPAGRPMQRYFDGVAWTEHYAALAPEPLQPRPSNPPNQVGPQFPMYPVQAGGTRIPWRGVAVAAAVVLLIAVVIVIATSREEDSYRAGRAYGANFASGVQALSGDRISEPELQVHCATGAALAHDREVYYWPGGQMKGSRIDKDDFKDGCLDAAKEVFRSR